MEKDEKLYPIGGYAPGNYFCTCVKCKETFQGDKRAVECEKCATRREILELRGTNRMLEAKALGFLSKLRNYKGEFWNPTEILHEYQQFFNITSNREGKI